MAVAFRSQDTQGRGAEQRQCLEEKRRTRRKDSESTDCRALSRSSARMLTASLPIRASILEMRRDHEEQLQRLKLLKDREIDAVTSATSHTRYGCRPGPTRSSHRAGVPRPD